MASHLQYSILHLGKVAHEIVVEMILPSMLFYPVVFVYVRTMGKTPQY